MRGRVAGALPHAAVALAAGVAGAALAVHHPLAPKLATLAFLGWTLLAAARPLLWLAVVPALLPLASLAPWTGWIAFDEFDLLLLGALAGGYARWAAETWAGVPCGTPVGTARGTGRRLPLSVTGERSAVGRPAVLEQRSIDSDPAMAERQSSTSRPTALGQRSIADGPAAAERQSATGSPGVPSPVPASGLSPAFALALAIAVWTVAGVVRGVLAAGPWPDVAAPFHGYTDPLNALRVAKAPLVALLAAPLVRQALERSRRRALGLVAGGMLTGTAAFGLAVLGERAAYPGVFDASDDYRATALFWEMHVGGAAIDAWCVLALPFAAWAVRRARTPGAWTGAAALALLAEYAWLVTYARGAFGGVLIGLGVAAWMLRRAARAGRATQRLVLGRTAPDRPRWRRRADALLVAALLAQAGWMLFGGSALRERLGQGPLDLGSRIAHWRHGLGLLRTPADAAFGLGLGRLPGAYARDDAARELPGEVRWKTAAMDATAVAGSAPPVSDAPSAPASASPGGPVGRRPAASDAPMDVAPSALGPAAKPPAPESDLRSGTGARPGAEAGGDPVPDIATGADPLRRLPAPPAAPVSSTAASTVPSTPVIELAGPARAERLGGRLMLTQRVALDADAHGDWRLRLVLRADRPVALRARVCTRHLLYEWDCRVAVLTAAPAAGWQRVETWFDGTPLDRGPWFAPRQGEFSLAVTTAGGVVALRSVSLAGPDGTERLANGDFAAGPARWWPLAGHYFLPWHIDSLYAETLIERGAVGLALLAAAFALAARGLLRRPADRGGESGDDDDLGLKPFLAASLAGAAALGTVSSLLDMPRTAFLFAFLLVLAVQVTAPARRRGQPGADTAGPAS